MSIKNKVQKIIIRLIVRLYQCLEFIFKQLFYFIRILVVPFIFLGGIFYRVVIFNIYRQFLSLNNYFNKLLAPVKNKYLFLFTNKYVAETIIVVLSLIIVLINLNIQETRAETFGRNSILYSLVSGTNLEDNQIVEESISSNEPVIQSYQQAQNQAIESQPQIITDESELLEKESEEEASLYLTEGGTALIKPDIASIEASKKQRDKIISYAVKEGDSIGTIAAQFSLAQTTILWANNLSSISYIQPGQSLIIPPTDGIIHKITKGDTLASIAKKYQANEQKIIEYNKLADASDLDVGSDLIIPEGRPYQVPKPKPSVVAPLPTRPTHVNVPQLGRMAWPTTTHRISQYYSWRHTGLDINGEFGDPIWAASAGIITRVQYGKTGYGFNVIVDHGGGIQTLYAHMQKIYVAAGQSVQAGDVLGEEGSTGRSTGSHLHFEVRVSSSRVNPLSYIR